MLFIYDYFMKNRLYYDIKFYRITKIKPFIEIRKYKYSPLNSVEHKIYSYFILLLIGLNMKIHSSIRTFC